MADPRAGDPSADGRASGRRPTGDRRGVDADVEDIARDIGHLRASRRRWTNRSQLAVVLFTLSMFLFSSTVEVTDEWGRSRGGRPNPAPAVVMFVLAAVQVRTTDLYVDRFRRGDRWRVGAPVSGRDVWVSVRGVALRAGVGWVLAVGAFWVLKDRARGVTTGVPHLLGLSRDGAFGVIVGLATVVAVLHIVSAARQAVATRRENELLAALVAAKRPPGVAGGAGVRGSSEWWPGGSSADGPVREGQP